MDVDSDKPASRVSILDAVELDKEIHNILKEQVNAITRYLPPGLLGYWEPEIDTLLKIIVWKLSVERACATFGQQILKLKYGHDTSRTKLNLLGLLTIGSHYLKERAPNIVLMFGGTNVGNMVRHTFDWCETGVKILNVAALIMFFRRSKASTFVECLLGLKPFSTVPPSARNIKYSYMTRELIWHGFIELLIFIIPLVNYHSIRRRLHHFLPLGVRGQSKRPPIVYRTPSKCPVCREVPILPHHMGCSHVFCYYCLAANRAADKKFECPLCGHFDEVESAMKPVHSEP